MFHIKRTHVLNEICILCSEVNTHQRNSYKKQTVNSRVSYKKLQKIAYKNKTYRMMEKTYIPSKILIFHCPCPNKQTEKINFIQKTPSGADVMCQCSDVSQMKSKC